jgi:hypothetical protein
LVLVWHLVLSAVLALVLGRLLAAMVLLVMAVGSE